MPPTAEDIYTEQVLKLKKGTPLYLPCAVEVGDVGFIDPLGGFFQKLYNVAKPPMDNEPGCPSRIFLESTCHPEQWDAFHLKKSKRFGASSNVYITEGQPGFEFSELEEGDCILIPGSVVVVERLEMTISLSKYMEEHIDWIESKFTESYQFSRESLMLVTRTARTDRWAIAVNTSSEVVKDVSFDIASVGATPWGEWSTSSLTTRSGPVPGKFLVPYNGASHPMGIEGADQTIFVF
ncbi:hypothetical protein V8E52_004189 [Russula decolorans]